MKKLPFLLLTLIFLASHTTIQAQEKVITRGQEVSTNGNLPKIGTTAPDFTGTDKSLNDVTLTSFRGKYVILNIFPSLDTPTCAMSVRHFNEAASEFNNAIVLCLSRDLPFAQDRFCTIEGIDNVMALSLFRSESFEQAYGLIITEGPLRNLTARAIIVLDPEGKIIYHQLVKNISDEPDYDSALQSIK